MILSIFLTRSYYFPVPPRLKPVNSRVLVNLGIVYPGEAQTEPRLSSVMPRMIPGESLQRPGRTLVYRHFAGTHRGYTGIRPWQSCANTPV
ncbi:hypothetical protein DPMN_107893 [Dreissena polymorpha]|uniref:Uncharacterized protein n=1 Tax=Dreissena polymorpha TaxID=45954 RepID=A0A9D4K7L6_DREPO|nr:hypothetical protein DPMN_107893 [Dreissena polymorpha]